MPPTAMSSAPLVDALRRFSTLVLATVVVCALASAALSFRGESAWSGDALYLVPPSDGTTSPGPLSPFDAERLARTYSVVVAEDDAVLAALGEPLGREPREVARRLTAVTLPSSSAIRVSYRGGSPAEVRQLFEVLTALFAAPPSDNVVPGTVRLLQVSDDVVRTGGGSWFAPLAGALAGLLLGGGAAVLLSRAHPVVRRAGDLREDGGPSVVDVVPGEQDSVGALAVRLLDGCPPGAHVAVLAASPEQHPDAERLAARLQSVTASLLVEGALPATAVDALWLPAPLGGPGERAAQDADRTLVVVPEGTGRAQVAALLTDLHDLGVADVVLAVLHDDRTGPAAPRSGDDASRLPAEASA